MHIVYMGHLSKHLVRRRVGHIKRLARLGPHPLSHYVSFVVKIPMAGAAQNLTPHQNKIDT